MTIRIDPHTGELILDAIRILVVFGGVLGAVPFMVLLERKLLARVQHRVGPNRVGPWGLLQTIVDGIKLFLKEDVRPSTVDPILHTLAPLVTLIPAIFVLAVVPLGPGIDLHVSNWSFTIPLLGWTVAFDDHVYPIFFSITNLDVSLLFYLAVTGLAVYGIVLAGYSSNSKYSLLGGIRASAQMLSYEVAMGLSLVGVLLLAGTFNLREIIDMQGGAAGAPGGFWHWNAVRQPVGLLLFMVAGFAETNRLPFDLAEGESELGGGFHTEYSSMKFAMFFMSEYMNMFTLGAILTTLFLGGYHAPLPILNPFDPGTVLFALGCVFWFSVKVFLFVSFMILVRGTWPRFRYDQLMDLGWKVMFPLGLVNLVLTAAVVALMAPGAPDQIGPTLTVALVGAGLVQLIALDRILTARRKRVLNHVS